MALPNIKPANTAGIPGFDNLSTSASSIIQNLLSGLPSPDESRLDNAYFGAGTGLDSTSPFLASRGRDLYGKRSETRQQQGIENLLKMLGTYSGTVAPTAGQEMQNNEFNTRFGYGVLQDQLARRDAQRNKMQLSNERAGMEWDMGGGGSSSDGRFFIDEFGRRKPLIGSTTSGFR